MSGQKNNLLICTKQEICSFVRVKRSHWKTLDQESERCSKELNPDTTGCIVKFIEETAGCTLPIYGANNLNGTKCDTNANLLYEFLQLNRFGVQRLII